VYSYIGLDGGIINLGIDMPFGYVEANLRTETSDIIIDPEYIEYSQNVSVTIPAAERETTIIIEAVMTNQNGSNTTRQYYIIQR
jgi:hypothetical protein